MGFKTLKTISESKQSAVMDGWVANGIAVSLATMKEGLEEGGTLYEEAMAMDKVKTFLLKVGDAGMLPLLICLNS